jgi:hypothetical protein
MQNALGNVWDVSAEYQVRDPCTTLYYGHAWGKNVISAIYPKDATGNSSFGDEFPFLRLGLGNG